MVLIIIEVGGFTTHTTTNRPFLLPTSTSSKLVDLRDKIN
jgi:hypothetical protein